MEKKNLRKYFLVVSENINLNEEKKKKNEQNC